ncbi:MAG: FecR domain-containing protein [Anaerohalosphaeraceae bacterium]
MKFDDRQSQFNELLLHALEGDMTEEQKAMLNRLLIEDSEAVGQYLDFMRLYGELSPYGDAGRLSGTAPAGEEQSEDYTILLQSLAQEESTAPTVCIADVKADLSKELIQQVKREKVVYKMSRSSVLTLFVSIAATVLIILFLRFSPQGAVTVATLTDSIDAVFSGGQTYSTGTRLASGSASFWLQKGIVKVEFDYGAEVVIEAPAEFVLNTVDDMTLRSGRLFAHVPTRSQGFTVETPMATVIDLGTEFAIKADFDGTSDVHLFKGKASLIPGAKGQAVGSSHLLQVDQARRVNCAGEVVSIPVQPKEFVRSIDSRTGLVWRGGELDLADIVSGGSGFGGGNSQMVIDPTDGRFMEYQQRGATIRKTTSPYSKVDALKYVDGVFVPDGGEGPIVVSSEGTLFKECPDTSGNIRKDISVLSNVYDSEQGRLTLGNTTYGYPGQPAITMHANAGITFDLDAIRNDLTDLEIVSFETLCAIAPNPTLEGPAASDAQAGRADFWIVVDGQVRKSLLAMPIDSSEAVRIPIQPQDRFLTIITTDHMVSSEKDPINSDRCFLGSPVLGVQSKDSTE